jgi:hypothetical protein
MNPGTFPFPHQNQSLQILPDCRKLCDLTSDLSSIPLSLCKLKNRHWWQPGEKYHRIEEVIKVILGPADISFELWYAGQKVSDDNSIKVEWVIAKPPPVIPPVDVARTDDGVPWDAADFGEAVCERY